MISDLLRNNVILDQVRSKVSADRTRFKDENINLDLSYITDNLIAMGFPASGIEAAWRNHIDEVAAMLDKYHGFENTLIFNLSDRKYNYDKFKNQIVEIGFPDHYSPPLHVLFHIVLKIDRWITADPKHVAVVHCMGGKGRTGTVVVCWLLMAGIANTAIQAFEYFATRRSKIYKGVTQASQKRYVAYFEDILRKKKPPRPKVYIITGIEISPVPLSNKKRTGCKLRLEVCSTHRYPEKVLWVTPFIRLHESARDNKIRLDQMRVPVAGDVLIRAAHVSNSGEKKKMFRIMFHTAFVQAGSATLRRADLDDLPKHKGTPEKSPIAPDFQVVIHFANPDPAIEATPLSELGVVADQDMDLLYQSLWDAAAHHNTYTNKTTPSNSSLSPAVSTLRSHQPTTSTNSTAAGGSALNTGLGDNWSSDTVRYGSSTLQQQQQSSSAVRDVQHAALVHLVQQKLAAGEHVPEELLMAAGMHPTQPQFMPHRRSTALTPKWDMTTYTAPIKGKGPPLNISGGSANSSLSNSSSANGSPSPSASGSPSHHIAGAPTLRNNTTYSNLSSPYQNSPQTGVPPLSTASPFSSSQKPSAGDPSTLRGTTHGISLGQSRDDTMRSRMMGTGSPNSSQTSLIVPASPRDNQANANGASGERSPTYGTSPKASPRGPPPREPFVGFARQNSTKDLKRSTQGSSGSGTTNNPDRRTGASGGSPSLTPTTSTAGMQRAGPPSPKSSSSSASTSTAHNPQTQPRSAIANLNGTPAAVAELDDLRPSSATAPPVSISTHLLLMMSGGASSTSSSSHTSSSTGTNLGNNLATAPTTVPSRAGMYIPGPDPLPKPASPPPSPSGSTIVANTSTSTTAPASAPMPIPSQSQTQSNVTPRIGSQSGSQALSPRSGTKLSLQRLQQLLSTTTESGSHASVCGVLPSQSSTTALESPTGKSKAFTMALAICLPAKTESSPSSSPRPGASPRPIASPRSNIAQPQPPSPRPPSPRPVANAEGSLSVSPARIIGNTNGTSSPVSSSTAAAQRVSVKDLVHHIESAPAAPAPYPLPRCSSKGSQASPLSASPLSDTATRPHDGPSGTLRKKDLPAVPSSGSSSASSAGSSPSKSLMHHAEFQRTRSYTKELPAVPQPRPSSSGTAAKPMPSPPIRASTQPNQSTNPNPNTNSNFNSSSSTPPHNG